MATQRCQHFYHCIQWGIFRPVGGLLRLKGYLSLAHEEAHQLLRRNVILHQLNCKCSFALIHAGPGRGLGNSVRNPNVSQVWSTSPFSPCFAQPVFVSPPRCAHTSVQPSLHFLSTIYMGLPALAGVHWPKKPTVFVRDACFMKAIKQPPPMQCKLYQCEKMIGLGHN